MSQRTFVFGALGALSLSLLLAFSTRGDAVSFHVEEGTTLTRSMEIGLSLNMDGGTISVMGNEEEMPAEEDPLEMDLSVEVKDTFTKMDGGTVVAMNRVYDTMAIEIVDDEDGAEDIEVEGETVYFAKDEKGGYTKALEEGGEDDSDLNGLTLDMDFTALLPEGEVEAGDSWEVGSAGLLSVFLPGGVPFSDDEESIESVIGSVALPLLSEGAEDFTITCTYVGVKEEGGSAEIAFEFKGSTGGDVAELIMGISEMEGDDADMMPDDINAEATIEFEGSGKLFWNLEGGHADAFEMVVEPIIEMEMDMTQDMGDQSFDLEFAIEFSGELTWNMSVE